MAALAERIERDQAASDLDGRGVVAASEVCVDEQAEDGAVAVEQRLAPRDRPVGVALLRQWLATPQPLGPHQQVEPGRGLVREGGGGRALELVDVHAVAAAQPQHVGAFGVLDH